MIGGRLGRTEINNVKRELSDDGWERGWKVVRVKDGLFTSSACNDLWEMESQVNYGVMSRANPKPGCGPLVCFTNVREAREFRDGMGHLHEDWRFGILECMYFPSDEDKVWDKNHTKKLSDMPAGSVLAGAIYPVS